VNKTKHILSGRNLAGTIVLAAAALVPLALGHSQYNMILATTVMLYAVLATAWNIIGGIGGQFDLAAGAYVGLGAFVTGTLLTRWNITPWLGMLVAGAVAALFAASVGFPLFGFKIRDLWYSLSSSALVEVLRVVFLMWAAVGGPTERYLGGSGSQLYRMRFGTYIPYYYLLLVILIISLILVNRIRQSKLGFSLLALGEDEDAAEVLGVNVRASKLKALMIYGYIHPSFFATDLSLEVAILGIVGGLGITWGPATAALIFVSMREFLRARLGGEMAGLYLVVYAIVLILVALYQPLGLAPLAMRGIERLKSMMGVKQRGITSAHGK
jgi:branched-chain amino acid transport system permease protein